MHWSSCKFLFAQVQNWIFQNFWVYPTKDDEFHQILFDARGQSLEESRGRICMNSYWSTPHWGVLVCEIQLLTGVSKNQKLIFRFRFKPKDSLTKWCDRWTEWRKFKNIVEYIITGRFSGGTAVQNNKFCFTQHLWCPSH